MFCDHVIITIESGHGGNGCVHFHREKFVPRGGPDGGNGGDGGDVIFVADQNINTLSAFHRRKLFKAEEGQDGYQQDMNGATGANLELPVPVGTIIRAVDDDRIVADLTQHGDRFIAAAGGRGGYGNAHFVAPTRQAPQFAELGDVGQTRSLRLDLKLVADIGIIGLPSTGKSTLISRVTNVRPKIADYPFTTLIPNLGVVDYKGQSWVLADIPGLIPGASQGKGLGFDFLRHTERTRALIHLLDASHYEDIVHDYRAIRHELEAYSPTLAEKPELVVINKCDLLDEDSLKLLTHYFTKHVPKHHLVLTISAATHVGLEPLLNACLQLLETTPATRPVSGGAPRIFRPHLDDPKLFNILKTPEGWTVSGPRIEQIVRMTPWDNREAMARIYDVMDKMDINQALLLNGAQLGEKVMIAGKVLEFEGVDYTPRRR